MDRCRTLSAFNVGDGDCFEQELERDLNRELDSMADELLTLLELGQSTAMVAFPLDNNASSVLDSTIGGDHHLPLSPTEDQDEELIAVLLEKLEFGRASTAVQTKEEPPITAETGEEEHRSNSSAFAVGGSNRDKQRHETSRRRTQSRRSRKPRIGRRRGSSIHHQQQQWREIAKRSSYRNGFRSSDRVESRSAAAAAAPRRYPHRSGPSRVIHGDHCFQEGATRATGGTPQSPAANTGVGGTGGCCASGGCCGAGRRVSGNEEIESPPRRGSCIGLSFFILRRRARGVLVTAAVLTPLSMMVTGREKRWPLVILVAPLLHALVTWVGVTMRASDRCVRRDANAEGGGVDMRCLDFSAVAPKCVCLEFLSPHATSSHSSSCACRTMRFDRPCLLFRHLRTRLEDTEM